MTMNEMFEDEELAAAAIGHDLGCYQSAAEVLCEGFAANGMTYETGKPDEVVSGMTIIEHLRANIAEGVYECCCGEYV
jgi:xylose isomerase